jgi:hypothetical protein
MMQVLVLLSSLVARNPDQRTGTAVKTAILQRSMSIITHQASQPLVKPAFKALECLLGKRTISTQELIDAYRYHSHTFGSAMSTTEIVGSDAAWDSLFSRVFEWMTLADISPAAGKFLVTVFRELRISSDGAHSKNSTASWQRWIREGLIKQPDALENVKNYLFPPLFKLDRPGSLVFLEDLNTQSLVWETKNQEFDAQALLQLAAIEVGKKSGLIEETSKYRLHHQVIPSLMILRRDSISEGTKKVGCHRRFSRGCVIFSTGSCFRHSSVSGFFRSGVIEFLYSTLQPYCFENNSVTSEYSLL